MSANRILKLYGIEDDEKLLELMMSGAILRYRGLRLTHYNEFCRHLGLPEWKPSPKLCSKCGQIVPSPLENEVKAFGKAKKKAKDAYWNAQSNTVHRSIFTP